MSSEPPPGSGEQPPPEDDPFRKRPPSDQGPGSPYDAPHGGAEPPPYGGGPYGGAQPPPYGGDPYGGAQPPPYGGDPYGGYPADPLAGMPPLAESGRRTLARIIDMILVGIVVALVTWGLGLTYYTVVDGRVEVGRNVARAFVTAVLYVAYDTVMISRSGQTLGKKWLGMRVANLENGATPSVQASLSRALVLWVPFAFCCACLWTAVSGGWSFFDKPYKQGLHDKAAKTVVVSTG
ncbi:RDD family protein [Streptomyces sp. Go40/10]|uniref:RDD family protein n=1 Tax=Streptomyces sp. Go40/10 TaxID=2825844 RepID=UPI001E2F7E59|nr:RDD family protein [Streptomyces sp. Go40/10]UFR04224.1 RDD family protein [Streptomyces sp. Go40/10]